jgi:hypothetical protein
LAALAFVALRPADAKLDDGARDHAEVACNLTSKAEEAARVDTGGRYAAAVLLLDQAMIESARAVESDPALAELDQAVQEVHVAGHSGDPGQWDSALGAALTACRASLR